MCAARSAAGGTICGACHSRTVRWCGCKSPLQGFSQRLHCAIASAETCAAACRPNCSKPQLTPLWQIARYLSVGTCRCVLRAAGGHIGGVVPGRSGAGGEPAAGGDGGGGPPASARGAGPGRTDLATRPRRGRQTRGSRCPGAARVPAIAWNRSDNRMIAELHGNSSKSDVAAAVCVPCLPPHLPRCRPRVPGVHSYLCDLSTTRTH